MRSISAIALVLVLSLSTTCLGAQFLENKKSCFFTTKYHVFIVSSLPPNTPMLSANCWSQDDNLGIHMLAPGQNFNFQFCESLFGSLFTCFLSWKDKGKTFDVFNSNWVDFPCDTTGQCFWFAQEDGIYFSDQNPPKNLVKRFEWWYPA